MGHWNYRIVKHHYPNAAIEEEKNLYEIHEVYYNADDTLRGFVPASLHATTPLKLKEVIDMVTSALQKPIIEESEFGVQERGIMNE